MYVGRQGSGCHTTSKPISQSFQTKLAVQYAIQMFKLKNVSPAETLNNKYVYQLLLKMRS